MSISPAELPCPGPHRFLPSDSQQPIYCPPSGGITDAQRIEHQQGEACKAAGLLIPGERPPTAIRTLTICQNLNAIALFRTESQECQAGGLQSHLIGSIDKRPSAFRQSAAIESVPESMNLRFHAASFIGARRAVKIAWQKAGGAEVWHPFQSFSRMIFGQPMQCRRRALRGGIPLPAQTSKGAQNHSEKFFTSGCYRRDRDPRDGLRKRNWLTPATVTTIR